MSCSLLDWAKDPGACVSETAKTAVGDAIANLANAVTEALGKAVASLGTIWVNIGTPNLTSTGQPGGDYSAIKAGTSAPSSQSRRARSGALPTSYAP